MQQLAGITAHATSQPRKRPPGSLKECRLETAREGMALLMVAGGWAASRCWRAPLTCKWGCQR